MIIKESTTASEQERIRAAISTWTNEKSEIRTFAINPTLVDGYISKSFLLSLPLVSLKDTDASALSLKPLSPHAACCNLFASASRGGPYDRGHGGAYGRLATWHSLAGLVGAPESATIEEIASLVEQCRWFSFTSENDWFYRIAWDLSILALRPDRSSLAVLAATAID